MNKRQHGDILFNDTTVNAALLGFMKLFAGLDPHVAVVLLIDAVELQELVLVFGEVGGITLQGLFDRAAKVPALLLDDLDRRSEDSSERKGFLGTGHSR